MWLFLALLLVPLIEIALFIEIGGLIGLWPTILTVILTALIGTLLLRAQGVAAIGDLQRRLAEGRDPGRALAHGAMILIAGVVLLTPGFFTDAIGFLLLVPAVREAAIRFIAARIVTVATAGATTGATKGASTAHPSASRKPGTSQDAAPVDAEFYDVTPEGGTTAPAPQQSSPAAGTVQPGGRPNGRASGWTAPPDGGDPDQRRS